MQIYQLIKHQSKRSKVSRVSNQIFKLKELHWKISQTKSMVLHNLVRADKLKRDILLHWDVCSTVLLGFWIFLILLMKISLLRSWLWDNQLCVLSIVTHLTSRICSMTWLLMISDHLFLTKIQSSKEWQVSVKCNSWIPWLLLIQLEIRLKLSTPTS